MKLRNKKTGEIGELSVWQRADNKKLTGFAVIKESEKFPTDYKNLTELIEEWEDYEEPRYTYWIDTTEERITQTDLPITDECLEYVRELGLGFTTREEAEKAVEKLKAWKRLEDKGFRFTAWYGGSKTITYEFEKEPEGYIPVKESADLDLLFGGEE